MLMTQSVADSHRKIKSLVEMWVEEIKKMKLEINLKKMQMYIS